MAYKRAASWFSEGELLILYVPYKVGRVSRPEDWTYVAWLLFRRLPAAPKGSLTSHGKSGELGLEIPQVILISA
jgi:hypothetical protein